MNFHEHRRWMFILGLAVLFAAGCKRKPDRLVMPDGDILSGRLELVDGARVVMDTGERMLPTEEARLFPRENSAGCRGRVEFHDGEFVVLTGEGESVFDAGDVASVVWSPASTERRIEVKVPASAGWVDTGLRVTAGEMLVIRAKGSVSMETGTCGPDGIDYFSTAMALVPGATNGQLVMRVNDDAPVAVGSGWTGEVTEDGELMLAVNRPNRESVAGVGGFYVVEVVETPGVVGYPTLYLSPNW